MSVTVEEHLRAELQAAHDRINGLMKLLDLCPMADMPRTGAPFNVMFLWTHRWLPYKASSQQAKNGIKGRWQRATGYGWENCKEPDADGWRPIEKVQS